jgi:hypothetical protein
MDYELNEFLNDTKIKEFLSFLKSYKPENTFIIQDSEFTRKNIARRYSARFNIFTASIEKEGYSIVCKIDQTNEYYSPKNIINRFNKPLLITGIGLYGEMFIKEFRVLEKITYISSEKAAPIIVYGSPKYEKLDKIRNLFNLFIDSTDAMAIRKLDWIFSIIASYLEK